MKKKVLQYCSLPDEIGRRVCFVSREGKGANFVVFPVGEPSSICAGNLSFISSLSLSFCLCLLPLDLSL